MKRDKEEEKQKKPNKISIDSQGRMTKKKGKVL